MKGMKAMKAMRRAAAISVVVLAAAFGAGACGSGSGPKTSPPGVATTAIGYVVAHGRVVSGPAMTTVKLGGTVSVSVTTDAPDELHVHGYDKEAETSGGKASVTFTAGLPGVFDIELHKSDLALGRLTVK